MTQALPTNQSETSNSLAQGNSTVVSAETTRHPSQQVQAEFIEDHRQPCFGPCLKCEINKIRVVFVDCGHPVCCFECSNNCSVCPECGTVITERFPMY